VIAGARTNTTKIGVLNRAVGKRWVVSGPSNIVEMNGAPCEDDVQRMSL
jgi:hypothetical protein